MIYRTEAFSILEIEPTEDKKQIKRAYANQVKKYHPEECPNEWKKIREAYETAIFYAEREAEFQQEPWEEDKLREMSYADYFVQGEKNELQGMFEQLDGLIETQKDREKDTLFEQIMFELEENAQYMDEGIWRNFFNSYDMAYFSRSEFLYRWADIIQDMKLSSKLSHFFDNKIAEISRYCEQNNIVPTQNGPLSPLKLVERRINSEKPIDIIIFFVLCAIFTVILQLFTGEPEETEYKPFWGLVEEETIEEYMEGFMQLIIN